MDARVRNRSFVLMLVFVCLFAVKCCRRRSSRTLRITVVSVIVYTVFFLTLGTFTDQIEKHIDKHRRNSLKWPAEIYRIGHKAVETHNDSMIWLPVIVEFFSF